jgi:hypothetical protein
MTTHPKIGYAINPSILHDFPQSNTMSLPKPPTSTHHPHPSRPPNGSLDKSTYRFLNSYSLTFKARSKTSSALGPRIVA